MTGRLYFVRTPKLIFDYKHEHRNQKRALKSEIQTNTSLDVPGKRGKKQLGPLIFCLVLIVFELYMSYKVQNTHFCP